MGRSSHPTGVTSLRVFRHPGHGLSVQATGGWPAASFLGWSQQLGREASMSATRAFSRMAAAKPPPRRPPKAKRVCDGCQLPPGECDGDIQFCLDCGYGACEGADMCVRRCGSLFKLAARRKDRLPSLTSAHLAPPPTRPHLAARRAPRRPAEIARCTAARPTTARASGPAAAAAATTSWAVA